MAKKCSSSARPQDRVYGSDGSSSEVWDKLSEGGFASDFYIDTLGTNGAFSPPIPRCGTTSAPPVTPEPPPSPMLVTDYSCPSAITCRQVPIGAIISRSRVRRLPGFTFPSPIHATPGQTLWLVASGIGNSRPTTRITADQMAVSSEALLATPNSVRAQADSSCNPQPRFINPLIQRRPGDQGLAAVELHLRATLRPLQVRLRAIRARP
jgi:hypothetical protein